MRQQFARVRPHEGEVWAKAWCAYIESGMAKKSDTAATTATIFADAAVEDYLKRFPKEAPEPMSFSEVNSAMKAVRKAAGMEKKE